MVKLHVGATSTIDLTLIDDRSLLEEPSLNAIELPIDGKSKSRVGGWIDAGFGSGLTPQ